MPEYVLKDFIYKNYHYRPKEAAQFVDYYAKKKWVHGVLSVRMEIFTEKTKKRLIKRRDAFFEDQYRNDRAKHELQKLTLKYSGEPSKEPIIVIQREDGIDIKEGWHRTIQSMKLWPEGYKQNAWMEIPKE